MLQKIFAPILAFFMLLPFATWGRGQENAYLTVVKAIVQEERNEGLKYLVVDLSQVKLTDTAKLEKAIKAYCDRRGITLLPDDFDWLVAEGYFVTEKKIGFEDVEYDNWRFPNKDGIVINFSSDDQLTKSTLKTDAFHSYEARVGGGCYYTVKRIGCVWLIFQKGIIIVDFF